MIPISVIVPVKNAEHMIDDCLTSIISAGVKEVLVIDGKSTDKTVERARAYPVTILTNDGDGVPSARRLGVDHAVSDTVFLVDVDIVLPEGTLQALYDEFSAHNYDALQAGLVSISEEGYWGEALAVHHNRGRSKSWPGVMATLFRREVLLQHRFDERFISGEDIELRWRLQKANLILGVSRKTLVKHRFDNTFDFAKDQFIQDGEGLGRMVSKYGLPAAKLLFMPAAGFIRGILISLLHLELKWMPYFIAYLIFNYIAIPVGLREPLA